MSTKTLSRRDFIRLAAVGTAGMLAACAQPTAEVIKEQVEVTRIVEVAGTPQVETVIEEVVVTATPEPVAEEAGGLAFPRSETLYANVLSGRVGAPTNFNEWVGWKNRDRGMAQLMNEPLWTVDPVTGEVINSLAAEAPAYNEDFTEMTAKLREGMYWSDGTEITADDVVFTIETLKATEGLNWNVQLQIVDTVTAPDKYTVVFTMKEPDSRLNTQLLDRWGCVWIMPKHVFEGVDDIMTFEYNPPLSSGPYVLHSFDPAGFWTAWERREDWDRTPTGVLIGEPKPKYVVFNNLGDPETQVMAQARHELDVADLSFEALRAVLAQNPYSRCYRQEYPWVFDGDPCTTGITFNCIKPPFDNKDVRWALNLAIDIVSYIATAYDGAAKINVLHTPATALYMKDYYEPMQAWLGEFTLDLGNGETFQPYDPDAPARLAQYAEARGYPVPEDVTGAFGYGWWKYAPDAAAKLLEKNGFSRDADGKWLLPDGTPWKIVITNQINPHHPAYRNGFAAAYEWRKFGIDVEVLTSEMYQDLARDGEFDCHTNWPSNQNGCWGGHPDFERVFDSWRSVYLEPELGKPMYGHASRWTDARIDEIVAQLKQTDFSDLERIIELGIEGLKVTVEEQPGLCTFLYPGVIGWDTYHWTNWPGVENPYIMAYAHWPNFKYMLPSLEATGN